MLHITFSNQLEFLLSSLLQRLQQTPASPFTPEEIIIPSAAMRRKIDLAITDTLGICANVRFSFLARWLWQQIGTGLNEDDDTPFAPPVMAWRIFALLDDPLLVGAHPRLSRYLQQADAVMRFDLATRTAKLFDQYLTYRADWMAQWSRGDQVTIAGANEAQMADQRWQAALWQRLQQDLGGARRYLSPDVLRDFTRVQAERTDAECDTTAPQVIHIFGLPTIAPVHLDALRELGKHIEIQLYLLNPCQEYWFDIVAPRRLRYLALQGNLQHHDVGNRLLATWGRQTQAQIDLVFETDAAATVDDNGFVVNPQACLLAQVQNAILELVDLAPSSVVLADDDRSIEIHSCHSLTRELEVLQDQLLALFAQADAPLPADVLVVLPNLDESAALIDAVFGSVPFARRIPYTITGRAAIQSNVAGQALLGVLALATSRVTASDVLALLQQPIIGRRFGFSSSELDLLHDWIDRAGIRWGLNAAHRESVGVPAVSANTFDDGMTRLLLGYALPNAVAAPFAGCIPIIGIEGSDTTMLGNFWHCLHLIEGLHVELTRPRTARDWQAFLMHVIDNFLAPDNEQIDQLDAVKDCVRELHDQLRRAELHAVLPQDVVRAALTALLDDPLPGGVPTGNVTFATMSSLRNLPYQVICVIGLNDGVFPATERIIEFDLMPLAPRRGDRQRGADDRNLMLDLILSARRRLYLSFTGHGIRDNASMPPSVLIADLLDYLVPAIAADANDAQDLAAARKRLLVTHPLQPFAAAYFTTEGDARIRSSNNEYCDALKQSAAGTAANASVIDTGNANGSDGVDIDESEDCDDSDSDEDALPPVYVQRFFSSPLPPPEPHWRTISLDQLQRFFVNPCRYLLQQRLGMRMPGAPEILQDDEPFVADWNGLHTLEARLLPLFLDGAAHADILAMAEAGNELPGGLPGRQLLHRVLNQLQKFAQTLHEATALPTLPVQQSTLPFDIDGELWTLTAAFTDLRANGLLRSRYDDTRPSDYLSGWIDHLVMNAVRPEGVIGNTLWLSRDGSYRLRATNSAAQLLGELIKLYRHGISTPLHFFPKAAWAFQHNRGDMTAARKKWQITARTPHAEHADPAYQLALRGIAEPLDGDFEIAARTVFEPLLQHLEDARL